MKINKKYRLIFIAGLFGMALFGIYWGASQYVPPMMTGEVKIGVITTSVSNYSSDLVIYDQDLKLQRVKSLDKYAGIGVGGRNGGICNRNYFTGMSGIMGVGTVDEFISIDMEEEKISEYPVSNHFLVSGATANQKYAYSYTNLNGQSILTQYSQKDKIEIRKVEYPVLFEWVAATDTYVFMGGVHDLGRTSSRYTRIYLFDAETLELVRSTDLTSYGLISGDNYLLTEDSLYIPMYYKYNPETTRIKENQETGIVENENKTREEIEMEEINKEIEAYSNKIVKLSLKDFSVSVIELARKTPRKIKKRGDTLFVVHENFVEEVASLTVYNEKTHQQRNYTLENLFFINFALSENSLYIVAVDDKVGYYFIYRYDIAEDDTLKLVKTELLEMDDSRGARGIGGMFVYTKEE